MLGQLVQLAVRCRYRDSFLAAIIIGCNIGCANIVALNSKPRQSSQYYDGPPRDQAESAEVSFDQNTSMVAAGSGAFCKTVSFLPGTYELKLEYNDGSMSTIVPVAVKVVLMAGRKYRCFYSKPKCTISDLNMAILDVTSDKEIEEIYRSSKVEGYRAIAVEIIGDVQCINDAVEDGSAIVRKAMASRISSVDMLSRMVSSDLSSDVRNAARLRLRSLQK